MNIDEMLNKKGIRILHNGGYFYKCDYNNNNIILSKNSYINNCYSLKINGKMILTKGHLTTCICKILHYKEESKKGVN